MENQEQVKGKLSRQKRHSRPEVRFGWILIAIGFIAGGILGIFQSPPLSAGQGWVVNKGYTASSKFTVIPDQNGDGIDDLFVWEDSKYYEPNKGSFSEWNLTAAATILDGYTGNIILQKKYEDQGILRIAWSDYPIIRTQQNEMIMVIGKITNMSSIDGDSTNFDIKNLFLFKIDLADLSITNQENLINNAWDSVDEIKNTSQIVMNFYYIPNLGIKTPKSNYTGDVIVYQNSFDFLNDDGNGLNSSKDQFTFINPQSFETISQINFSNQGINAIKLCKLPPRDTQLGWCAPYFGLSYNEGYPSSGYFCLTSIDKMNNSRSETEWLIPSINYYNSAVQANGNGWSKNDMVLLANSTGNFTSVLLTEDYFQTQSLSPGFSDVNEEFFYYADEGNVFQKMIGSRVTCFNIQNLSTPFISFQESAKLRTYDFDIVGINSTNSKGIPIKTVVTQEANAMSSDIFGPNSIAIVWSDLDFQILNISKNVYPYLKYTITYLSQQAAGTSGTTQIFLDCTNGTSDQIDNVNGTYIPYYYPLNSITNFDINNDNRTDVVLTGTIIDINQITLTSKEESNPVTGPYFAITREKVQQTSYHSVRYLSDLWCTQDMNNDSISDVGFRYIAVLFTQKTAPVELSWFDAKLQDDSTRTILYFGIAFTVIGLLILILALSIMASEGDVKFIKRPSFILLILVAGLLVTLLYTRLISLQNAINNEFTEVRLGSSPDAQAVSNILRVSAWASFVYVTLLPMTVGLYVLLTPSMAENAVILNEFAYAKKAAFNAVKTHTSIQDTESLANVNYKVMILPPFGKKMGFSGLFSRILSIVALAISIGLYCFKYIGNYFFHTETFESFVSIADPNFSIYLQALFLTLIIPGIIAIPVFVWLIPSSWLLDDAGVLFYVKSTKLRKPEDVESIALWFSSALKGFLGISAIANYLEFILKSPILSSPGIMDNTNIVDETLFFVFGFLVVVALSMGILSVIIHEITMPYSANRLYRRLDARQIDTVYKSLEFKNIDKLSPELVIDGFLNLPENPKKKKEKSKEELKLTTESENESNMESTVTHKTEQISPKTDSKLTPKIESKPTNKEDPKLSQKIEQKNPPKIESKSEGKSDPKKDSKKPMK